MIDVELREAALPAAARVVERVVDAEAAAWRSCLPGEAVPQTSAPRALGDLGRGDADAAGGRVDQHALARLRAAP